MFDASRLVQLSEDVHVLSYALHPAILEDLKLVEALKADCAVQRRRGNSDARQRCNLRLRGGRLAMIAISANSRAWVLLGSC